MSKVISVGTADIPYTYSQEDAKDFATAFFTSRNKDIERMIGVFDNAMIDKRHFCFPREWYTKPHNFVTRSENFRKISLSLSHDALVKCLKKADADKDDIDHIIFVSSTGLSAPTIDAYLINDLKLDPHIKRTPIWGLGCAGGASGLSRAMDLTKAHPESAVLVIAVEICSLAFQLDDYSKSNIVAIALFSDGAACCLVAGDKHRLAGTSGIELKDSFTTTYYESIDVMGWEIVETGFRAIFSKDIPSIVRNRIREDIDEFLSKNRTKTSELEHFVIHPGGTKVIIEFEKCLGLDEGSFVYPRKVLREHGNMSSATVLYVMDEFLMDNNYKNGEKGLISAMGPGFSSEFLLFEIQ